MNRYPVNIPIQYYTFCFLLSLVFLWFRLLNECCKNYCLSGTISV